MSFLDLASLTTYRQQELEARVNNFLNKCDRIIKDINKLKLETQGFVQQLNCEPSELKDRFLNCVKKLEEYNYVMTDFTLAVEKLDICNTENSSVHHSMSTTPSPEVEIMTVLSCLSSSQSKSCEEKFSVTKISQTKISEYTIGNNTLPISTPTVSSDNITKCNESNTNDEKLKKEKVETKCNSVDTMSNNILTPTRFAASHLMDVLSEPQPSTSNDCHHTPSTNIHKKKILKSDQLIAFSSNSCSTESVPETKNTKSEKKDVRELSNKLDKITVNGPKEIEDVYLPAQTVLQVDAVYPACIMHVDCTSLWIITDNIEELISLGQAMNKYYMKHNDPLTSDEIESLTYCAIYDEETESYYRAFKIDEDEKMAKVFLVDTGEIRSANFDCIQPLLPEFCSKHPLARCCHLAEVDILSYDQKDLEEKVMDFLKNYIGTYCQIRVDDNSSDALDVYVLLPNQMTLNDLLVKEGLAVYSDSERPRGSPIMFASSDLDITGNPEYDDPVKAVTGYHNRDEADICKHYKGGPEKTCFKGARCKKRHVLKHPNGWTLDRVEVAGALRPTALPAPDEWLRIQVTAVAHYDGFYAQPYDTVKVAEEMPRFGVVLPPMTLQGLIRDMNSPAVRQTYKPLEMAPAPGELVASLYPLDGQWYRARVLSTTRADQSVEVIYIDYGNTMWVKEDGIRVLDRRFTVLPAQAIRCRLAGVVMPSSYASHQWAAAKRALQSLAEERLLDAHVISRDYDELTVELYDDQGRNIAEELAKTKMVQLREYAIQEDNSVKQKIVVP